MGKVDLPVVAIPTDLGAAIAELKKSRRAALLAKVKGKYHLYSAGNIVVSRKKGADTLFDLQPNAVLTISVPGEEPQGFDVQVALPGEGGGGGKGVDDYVLGKVTVSSAFLKIRDSVLAFKYVSSPKDYYCDGPRHHDDFPPPDVSEGDPCPHKDGYKVVSAK